VAAKRETKKRACPRCGPTAESVMQLAAYRPRGRKPIMLWWCLRHGEAIMEHGKVIMEDGEAVGIGEKEHGA
jgi:hypothetical protein